MSKEWIEKDFVDMIRFAQDKGGGKLPEGLIAALHERMLTFSVKPDHSDHLYCCPISAIRRMRMDVEKWLKDRTG